MNKYETACDCEIIHKNIVDIVKNKILSPNELSDMVLFYKAFANDTRLKIISALSVHEMCVCDVAALLKMTKSAVSHQLKYLKRLNITTSRKNGKIVFYSLADDHVKQLFETCHEHIKEAQNG